MWPDGCKHEGIYIDGLKEGHGIFNWPDGSRYEGEFKDDQRTGTGTFTWPSGDVYDGEFAKGVCHGKGFFLPVAQDWSLEGSFAGNKPTRGLLSEIAPPPIHCKLFNVEYDSKDKKAKPLPTVPKTLKRFEVLDRSSVSKRRPLPSEPQDQKSRVGACAENTDS